MANQKRHANKPQPALHQKSRPRASVAIRDWGMLVPFSLYILALGLLGMLLPDRELSPMENRYLVTKPELEWRSVLSGDYMRAFDAYLTDQFPGRDFWISFKALCQRETGQKENNDVYFAADGYLIGKPQKPDADVTENNLASVLALRRLGYDVSLIVSPMAAQVLQDKLPVHAYDPVQARLIAKLRLEAADVFVDVEPALRQAADKGRQVFFRTDHHWTMGGAYEAYAAYMLRQGLPPLPLSQDESVIVSTDFLGTLWSKCALPGIVPDEIRVYPPVLPIGDSDFIFEMEFFDGNSLQRIPSLYQNAYLEQKDQYAFFLGQNQPLLVIRRIQGASSIDVFSDNSSDPRILLLFKDSYAHCLVPFLAPHYDEIHMVDLRYWRHDPLAYMEEHGVREVLFLYNADNFSSDRSISMLGAYITGAETKGELNESTYF
ncbi:MAG: DHHW family protein [Clostridiales bacterium]|nr:DHHW family protein [Clostridiales bacterium]